MLSDREGHASHLEILEMIHAVEPISKVLEYGCGRYSTPWFVENCDYVRSVELAQKWLDIAAEQIVVKKAIWKPEACSTEYDSLLEVCKEKWSVALIDGARYYDRHAVAQCLISTGAVRTVICHDAERCEYLWNTIALPNQYYALRIEGAQPWTLIISTDDRWLSVFGKKYRCSLYRNTEEFLHMSYPAILSFEEQQRLKNGK